MNMEAKAKEEQEALVPVETQADAVAIPDKEDPEMMAVIKLPTYTDVTDQKVLKSVKDVFKGFDPDTGTSGIKFNDIGALATYTTNSMEEIRNAREKAEASQILYRAAAMARFWYLGQTIDRALVNGEYGTSAVNKLAAALKKSPPYIYQIRAVATKLTVTDCYLLGIRGLESTHLRKLAQVKDDNVRKAIIDTFIEACQDTSDPDKLELMRKKLVTAINAPQDTSASDIGSSDPMHGGTETEVSPVFTEAVNYMAKISKNTKQLADNQFAEDAARALDYFSISQNTPDAEKKLAEVKEKASALVKQVSEAIANMQDIREALKSIDDVTVTE